MEAARRLRKSYTNRDINYNNFKSKKNKNHKNIKVTYRSKIAVKIFLCSLILFIIILFKYVINIDNIYINNIKYNYSLDYQKNDILEKLEEKIKVFKVNTKEFIPEELTEFINFKYISIIKPTIIKFDFKSKFNNLLENNNNDVNIYTEIDIYSENLINYDDKESKQVSEEKIEAIEVYNDNGITEEKINESSISSNDESIEKIKEYSFIVPVSGIITSKFGVREVIFKGVNSYHTGIDIANSLNTDIKSSTSGIVSNIVYGDKYYGNYIEVTIDKVTTKYAHLNEILVTINKKVNQGDIIGKMGTTGMSTGSHLHFEIWYNKNKLNPEEVITF